MRFARGVGEARAAQLARMNIFTVGHLLLTLPRRYEDRNAAAPTLPRPDLWHTMNVVQENAIRGGLHGTQWSTNPDTGRREHKRITTREIRGIDQDVRLNKALWSLSEKMATLKHEQAA